MAVSLSSRYATPLLKYGILALICIVGMCFPRFCVLSVR
jgi:hypothetical protein